MRRKIREAGSLVARAGLHVGSLLGLLVAPPLIENLGWESVFYLFGILGAGLPINPHPPGTVAKPTPTSASAPVFGWLLYQGLETGAALHW